MAYRGEVASRLASFPVVQSNTHGFRARVQAPVPCETHRIAVWPSVSSIFAQVTVAKLKNSAG